jgi:hypothetical protein
VIRAVTAPRDCSKQILNADAPICATEPLRSDHITRFSAMKSPDCHLMAFIGGEASCFNRKGRVMKRATILAGVVCALFAAPVAAQAQGGIPGGAAHGFNEGGRIAGPVGAVVGTAVGGVIGGVEGVLGIQHPAAYAPDFAEAPPPRRMYRHHRHHRSAKRMRRHHRPAPGYVTR